MIIFYDLPNLLKNSLYRLRKAQNERRKVTTKTNCSSRRARHHQRSELREACSLAKIKKHMVSMRDYAGTITGLDKGAVYGKAQGARDTVSSLRETALWKMQKPSWKPHENATTLSKTKTKKKRVWRFGRELSDERQSDSWRVSLQSRKYARQRDARLNVDAGAIVIAWFGVATHARRPSALPASTKPPRLWRWFVWERTPGVHMQKYARGRC